MTVRRGRGEGARTLLIFTAVAVPLLLSGCATPRTHFDWGVSRTANRQPQRPVTRPAQQPRCACNNTVPEPTPRPTPAWYHPDNPAPQSAASETPAPVSTGSAQFSWPLRGRVISDYGATADGARNDGINIAVADGEPIRAAADGTVSYTGNALKGYGNLTLIKHDNGYITAYAHAERFIVNRGDHVMRGQVIGYAGETGDVATPQLHFEIRSGMKPVNPHSLLGSQVASR